MVDVRTLAAAVLGVALGLLFVLAPETIVRVQTAGRLPQDRHGRYGEDSPRDGSGDAEETGVDGVPTRWRQLVRVVGAALILGGAYFGWTLV
ncbi:hypothetical protein [Halobellus inordinatus]|uniref:hypothetical protein n=1 Tax=Halobellus inordinatus TaxID=1126236 RepID=UPI00210D36D8|nr:hypothetical protein [Halobellus inordinatus]